jgi:hypothetical protein
MHAQENNLLPCNEKIREEKSSLWNGVSVNETEILWLSKIIGFKYVGVKLANS